MPKHMITVSPEIVESGLVSVEQQLRIERFLAWEAAMLDDHQYDLWFAAWCDGEIEYWVPCNDDDQDPQTAIAIIYDDRFRLEERLMRLKDRLAHAFHPRARMTRCISNVFVTATDADNWQVASSFVLGEIRSGQQRTWYGKCEHVLEEHAGALRIRHKKVYLLNNDEPMPNLTFLV